MEYDSNTILNSIQRNRSVLNYRGTVNGIENANLKDYNMGDVIIDTNTDSVYVKTTGFEGYHWFKISNMSKEDEEPKEEDYIKYESFTCKNCGGNVKIINKYKAKCEYCNTEYNRTYGGK